ncbi:MAG: hypothetical protein LBK42_07690 [Propionibacteriaceae bacterium]|jgi:hypothetical protein|nr:hypothetical protein [Propionibacteriaceae bacterium]
MRASAVLGEVWRDTVGGASRAVWWAAVLAAAVSLVAWADVRSVVSILRDAAAFRAGGGAVQVLKADGLIDGRRCDALAQTAGVTAAGAIRPAPATRLWSLPSSPVTSLEATPGFIALLAQVGQSVDQDASLVGGVWLSSDLAQVLGLAPGQVMRTAAGPAVVAGVYSWPDDGRSRELGYAMVVPVPATTAFAQCWAQLWPGDPSLDALPRLSLDGAVDPAQLSSGQLNPSLGRAHQASARLAARPTAWAPWAAAGVGLVLGYAATRGRRLELAAALQARVPRAHLVWQHLLETGLWAGAGMVVAAAGLLWGAAAGNPDPGWAVWLIGARSVAAGGAAALAGAVIGAVRTRQKDLWRHFQER